MNAPHPATTLKLESLRCSPGNRPILNNVSLPPLHGGQLVALTGPNGSGKSTLLRALAGLLPAHAACLTLNDSPLQGLSLEQRSRLVRYLPQALPGPLHLSVTEALMVAVKLANPQPMREDDVLATIDRTLRALNIGHLANRYLDELSGGQQQLVALAQTLVNAPAVLLLDEPLASLDLNYQHHVLGLLQQLCTRQGMLVIVVMHDLNLALAYAQELLVLHHGQLATAGKPETCLSANILQQVFSVQAYVTHQPGQPPSLFVQRPLPLDDAHPPATHA